MALLSYVDNGFWASCMFNRAQKKKELSLVFSVELNWAWFFNGYRLIWFATGLNDTKWACLGIGKHGFWVSFASK